MVLEAGVMTKTGASARLCGVSKAAARDNNARDLILTGIPFSDRGDAPCYGQVLYSRRVGLQAK
jgi:hypothetical protein